VVHGAVFLRQNTVDQFDNLGKIEVPQYVHGYCSTLQFRSAQGVGLILVYYNNAIITQMSFLLHLLVIAKTSVAGCIYMADGGNRDEAAFTFAIPPSTRAGAHRNFFL
jgi:hypothetical protein